MLRIDPPRMPELQSAHLDTGHGTRSALLDLGASTGRVRLAELVATADVVALGYRATALARLGLAPAALAARRPAVVILALSAWGTANRRGGGHGELLDRRARIGGSWLAQTSLRRIAAELLGMVRTAAPEPPTRVADDTGHLQRFVVGGHELTTAAPALQYEGGPTAFAPSRPWGEDEPVWI